MLTIFKKLMWFFKAHKKKYIVALSALTLVNIFEIIPPRLIGMAVDDIHTGRLTTELLIRYIIMLIITTVGSYIFGYIWRYQLFGGGFLLEKSIRYKLMNQFLKMKPKFYQKYRTGDLMARSTNDLGSVGETAGYGVLTLFDATMFMGVIILMMVFTVDWRLTLVATIPLPIHAFLMAKLGLRADKIYDAAQDAFSDLNDSVLESITGVRVIRAYVREQAEIERFKQMTENVYEKNRYVELVDSFWGPGTRILVGISFFLTLTFGTHLILANHITVGDLITFNVYLGMLIWPMFAIGELISVMQRGKASLERISEVLDVEPDVVDVEKPISITTPKTIQFKNLTFTYPEAPAPALNNINLTIKQGETIGIVGKTGSGKTTLVRQFLKQYPVHEQAILIDGIPLEEISQAEVLNWSGYVPQEHILFSKSVKENILYGTTNQDEAYLTRIIELSALTTDLEFFTDGLETIVGEKGVALSGGQKQRISIARAMATNPEILILDDSLSAVDAKTETQIVENIKAERSATVNHNAITSQNATTSRMGKTTIITAHRMSAVKHADQIIVMENGKISELGTHDELMRIGGWYKEQYDHQNLMVAAGGDD